MDRSRKNSKKMRTRANEGSKNCCVYKKQISNISNNFLVIIYFDMYIYNSVKYATFLSHECDRTVLTGAPVNPCENHTFSQFQEIFYIYSIQIMNKYP